MSDSWQDGYDKATDELTDKIAGLEDALVETKDEIERLKNNLNNIDSALYTFEKEARRWI
jgi:prefoldin subunit 5